MSTNGKTQERATSSKPNEPSEAMQAFETPAAAGRDVRVARRPDARTLMPAVDIQEDETGILVLADMPGVPKDALKVDVEGDVLSIEGEIRLDAPERFTPLYDEVGGRRYARSFTLSKELDASAIGARMENGVLRLHIPKAAAMMPRKVEVSFG